MKFLVKTSADLEALSGLSYENTTDRKKARELLAVSQRNFCAYSERYIKELDSEELEHFDNRLKGTSEDGPSNWHLVVRWMNAHKRRKIENYEPLPDLDEHLNFDLIYKGGLFRSASEDCAVENLLTFLGVNRPEVVAERTNHVNRLRLLQQMAPEALIESLGNHPEEYAYPTALKAELGIELPDS